jgi:hypothetical protein
LHQLVATHFGGRNPYRDKMERNIAFLKEVLADGDFDRLRRKSVTLSVARDPASRR